MRDTDQRKCRRRNPITDFSICRKFLRDCVIGLVWNWILSIYVLLLQQFWCLGFVISLTSIYFQRRVDSSLPEVLTVSYHQTALLQWTYLCRKQLLYSCAHCADCELCLTGHDVSGLDVAVIHGVLERSPSVGVLVAHVAVEGDFGSSSEMNQCNQQLVVLTWIWICLLRLLLLTGTRCVALAHWGSHKGSPLCQSSLLSAISASTHCFNLCAMQRPGAQDDFPFTGK